MHFNLTYRLYKWKKAIDRTMAKMQATGELRKINQAKAARAADPVCDMSTTSRLARPDG
jgi:hypothetical protein